MGNIPCPQTSGAINKMTAKYHFALRFLHWLMAISFLAMLISGIVMANANISNSLQFKMIQWHKSLGVLLLVTICIRLIVRLVTKIPNTPNYLTKSEKVLSKHVHVLLYIMMFLLPISGWVMVSASVYGLPTIVFGTFTFPHIPFVSIDNTLSENAGFAHFILAIIFMVLIALHLTGAIKHAVIDKRDLFKRIL